MNPTKLISKGSFGYHVLTLAGGTLAGQLILFVSLPFLQRYFYGPEAFGLLTVYVAVSELLIDISGLKYEYGIVRMHSDKEAVNLAALSFTCVCATALLSGLVFAVLYFAAPELSFVQDLGAYLFLIPFSVLFFGGLNTLGYWFNRSERYKTMAGGKLVNSLASEPVKFAWGLGSSSGLGLILGRIAGQMAAFAYTLRIFLKENKGTLHLVSGPGIKHLAREQKRYPLFVMPSTLITLLITVVYVQFFASYFGKEKVGLLGVSVSYIGVAFGILSGAIGQVFYKKIAHETDYRTLKKLYLRFTRILFVPALAATVAVYAVPESWITTILGSRWGEILPITRIMVPWMGIAFVSSSLSFMHIRLGTQNRLLVIDVLHLVGVCTALFGGYFWFDSFYGILYCFAAAQAVHYILVILAAIYFLNQRIKTGASA